MGDISAEPSMEEILSSIKRIIAEEGDVAPGRQRRQSRAAASPPSLAYADDSADSDEPDDEILELSDPMPMVDRPSRAAKATAIPAPEPAPEPIRQTAPVEPRAPATPPEPPFDAIASSATVAATRAPLEALTRMMVKPEPGNDGTLEGLVREMLRPMLREWIDTNLPGMVEDMVAREIAKITGQ